MARDAREFWCSELLAPISPPARALLLGLAGVVVAFTLYVFIDATWQGDGQAGFAILIPLVLLPPIYMAVWAIDRAVHFLFRR